MSNTQRQRIVGAMSTSIFMCTSFAAFAMNYGGEPEGQANINLAVASNFFGVPPSNSAITDLINAFEALHPSFTVTVVDNGATATLESNIINGNAAEVDLFLAADTATPQDLLVNHFELVAPYNSSRRPPLYTFNYAGGLLALLSNTPGVDLSCATGTCGYSTTYSSVAIADPDLAPYGVAAQSVLIGTYNLKPPLSSNSLVHEYPNITASLNAVIAKTDPVGFVAMSAICADGKFPTSGTSAVAYFPVQGSPTNPSLLTNGYNPLTQAGIAIRKHRSREQDAELKSFVEFLTDFTSPPTPDSPMMITLKKFCYSAPEFAGRRIRSRPQHETVTARPGVDCWVYANPKAKLAALRPTMNYLAVWSVMAGLARRDR